MWTGRGGGQVLQTKSYCPTASHRTFPQLAEPVRSVTGSCVTVQAQGSDSGSHVPLCWLLLLVIKVKDEQEEEMSCVSTA